MRIPSQEWGTRNFLDGYDGRAVTGFVFPRLVSPRVLWGWQI